MTDPATTNPTTKKRLLGVRSMGYALTIVTGAMLAAGYASVRYLAGDEAPPTLNIGPGDRDAPVLPPSPRPVQPRVLRPQGGLQGEPGGETAEWRHGLPIEAPRTAVREEAPRYR